MIKRSTWILLAIFALAICAYFYLKTNPLRFTTPTSTPTVTSTSFLVNKNNEVLSRLSITNTQGGIFEMERDSTGNWIIVQPRHSAADQSQAEAAETQIFALGIVTTLETSPSPDVLGLNPPADTLTIELSDGRQQVFEVGGLTPTSSGYYIRSEGKIYVIKQYSIDSLLELINNPPYPATPIP